MSFLKKLVKFLAGCDCIACIDAVNALADAEKRIEELELANKIQAVNLEILRDKEERK